MAEIRWKKGDFIKLGKAVADFNKTISRLERENKNLYLPDKITYSDLKDKIVTRKGFNEAIKDLKSLNDEASQKSVKIENGDEVLKWYYDKVNRNAERRERELINDLAQMNLAENKRQKPFRTDEEKQARAELKNLKNLWKPSKISNEGSIKKLTKGEILSRPKALLKNNDIDSQIRKEKRYYENYIEVMKKYKSLQNYNKLEDYFKKTNAHEFWLKVKDDEMLKDLTYESDNTRSQDSFNKFLEELGIETENKNEEPVNLNEAEHREVN